jgi:hypothetical protein
LPRSGSASSCCPSPGRKRARISAWLDRDLAARFDGRIIGIERAIAEAWAAIVARGRACGATPPILDAFVAATALVHSLTLVTRNEHDLMIMTLWRSLQVEDDYVDVYQITLRWFLGSILVVFLSLVMAMVAYSGYLA